MECGAGQEDAAVLRAHVPGLDRDALEVPVHCEEADLQAHELAGPGLDLERHAGPAVDPALRQVAGHADGIRAVLGEEQEGLAGVLLQEGPRLLRGGDHLHGREGLEGVARLDLDEPGRRQLSATRRRRAPPRVRPCRACHSVSAQSTGFG